VKVKIFMNTAGHNHEREILRMMHDGIKDKLEPKNKQEFKDWKRINKELGLGAGVDYAYDEKYSNCDVAVMLGSWKSERLNIHHIVRSSIVEESKCFICIETPLLGRRVFESNMHQRVGINGFLNRAAIFGEEIDYPNDRLAALKINYTGWNKNAGSKIVIALQLAGDASLRNNDINQWCRDTVDELRLHTDRPVEIRTHPAMSAKGWGNHEELFRDFLFGNYKNISFVNGREVPWEKQILDAYCVITYTSGLAIDAVVRGIPVIACDEGNFAWNVAERKLRNIESLNLAKDDQVQQWLRNLAYCQWSPEEMESGECWSHLKSSIDKVIALP
jgi:hypothetical protein